MSGDNVDLIGTGFNFTQYLTENLPTFIDADVGGKARRFTSSNSESLNADATSLAGVFQSEDFTIQARLRWRDVETAQTLFMCGGDSSSGAEDHNYQIRLALNASGQYKLQTESGAGISAVHTFTEFASVKDRTHTLAIRARSGAVSGTRYDLFINGHFVETSADLVTPTGGALASLMLGGTRDTASVSDFADVDIHNFMIYGEALTVEQIEDDARRAQLLPLHSTIQIKAEIEDQSATMIDVTDLEGVDWLDSFSYTDSAEDPVRTASVDLLRETGNLSLSYLKTDTKINLTDKADSASYDPFIDVQRSIELFAARIPLFISADDADFLSVFDGIIDSVDWGSEKVSLSCRDNGARLVDAYIETEHEFGPTATQTLETSIQQILNDNDSSAVSGSYPPVTLFAPIASTWILNIQNANGEQLLQRREPVMSANRNLSGQIGWETKYLFDPDPLSGGWKYTLFEPERLRNDVDMLLSPDDIDAVTQLKVSAQRTRSDVRIVYPSSETTTPGAVTLPAGISEIDRGWIGVDGAGNRTFAYIHVANTAARTKYGRRFFEMAEASTSAIDTITEAARMASNVCLDLSEPEALYDIGTPNMFEHEANDVIKMMTNKFLHTGAQKLAVTSVTHEFGDTPKSSFKMRGKPSVGFKRWMVLGTYPGQSRPPTINPFNALEDLTVGQITPYVMALIERTNYFADKPKFAGVRNGSFASSTRGSENPPDNWTHFNDAPAGLNWGPTRYAEYEYTVASSGDQSIKFNDPNGPISGNFNQLRSSLFKCPTRAGGAVTLQWTDARGAVTGTESIIELFVFFYDQSETLISSAGPFSASTINEVKDVFIVHTEEGIPVPALTRNIKVYASPGDSGSFDTAHYLDQVDVFATSDECSVTMSGDQTNGAGTNPVVNQAWTPCNLDTEIKDYGGGFDNGAGVYEFTCQVPGSYDLIAGVRAYCGGLATLIESCNVKMQLDTGSGYADLVMGPGGTFNDGVTNAPEHPVQASMMQYYLSKGDKIRVLGYIDYGVVVPAVFGFKAGIGETFFSAKLRQNE